jgi:DNA polymerase III subunit delta'
MNSIDISRMPWLQAQLRQYGQMISNGRLPHALSIEGPAGLGKRLLGEHLLRWLLCGQPGASGACGRCADCLQLAAGQHPDQILIEPDSDSGRQITIKAIRTLSGRLALRPQRQGRQVALLVPAEALNEPAANALLKTLEEPSDDSHLILVSHQPTRLPITLRSRCVRSTIAPPPAAELRHWLADQTDAQTDLELILIQCAGRPLHALAALGGEQAAQWQQLRQIVEQCLSGRSSPMAGARSLAQTPDLALDFLAHMLEAAVAGELQPDSQSSQRGLTSARRQSTLWLAWQACRQASAQLGSGLREDLALAQVLDLCVQALGPDGTRRINA